MLINKLCAFAEQFNRISAQVDNEFAMAEATIINTETHIQELTNSLEYYHRNFKEQLNAIYQDIQNGFSDPSIPFVLDYGPPLPRVEVGHQIRIGVIGLTANPLHYGHIFLGLQAMHECQLDKVVYLTQGFVNKAGIIAPEIRHDMVAEALKTYNPLQVYSPLGKDTWEWAEQRLMTLIKLNDPEYHYVQIGGDDRVEVIFNWSEKFAEAAGVDVQRIKVAIGPRENNNERLFQSLAKLRPDQQSRFEKPLSWTEAGASLSSSLIRAEHACHFVPYPAQQVIRKYGLYTSNCQ